MLLKLIGCICLFVLCGCQNENRQKLESRSYRAVTVKVPEIIPDCECFDSLGKMISCKLLGKFHIEECVD